MIPFFFLLLNLKEVELTISRGKVLVSYFAFSPIRNIETMSSREDQTEHIFIFSMAD